MNGYLYCSPRLVRLLKVFTWIGPIGAGVMLLCLVFPDAAIGSAHYPEESHVASWFAKLVTSDHSGLPL